MLIYILAFILGSSIASFLNVVAKSVPIKQNWWSRRSACPHCQTILTPLQLFPILSFLAQVGRCKTCRTKISPIYLLTEIIGGLLFILPFVFLPTPTTYLILTWVFFSLLLTVTLTDLYYGLIPNKILIGFGIPILLILIQLNIATSTAQYPSVNQNPLLLVLPNIAAAIVGFLFFTGTTLLGKVLFKKETIGGGDIKLYLVTGLVLGVQSLLLSIAISSIVALVYVLVFVRNKNKPIPFAPFIALGTIIAYILSFQ